jgi:hypothetical protein
MGHTVLVDRLYGPWETVLLDVESGSCQTSQGNGNKPTSGNVCLIAGQIFAVYVDESTLYFQWNDRRWNLTSPNINMRYRHDFERKVTVFSVDEKTIEYPAWWRDDPTFDPHIPERDEEEDYLGYVFSFSQNPGLQKSLLKSRRL